MAQLQLKYKSLIWGSTFWFSEYLSDTAMKWHVIHTKVREEFRALENLQNQGFEVFLPTCRVQKKYQQTLKLVTEPLFARYLFIRLSNVTSNWFPIRSTRGVAQLLRFGQSIDPVVIPDAMVECLKDRCSKEEPLHQLFHPGELLEITQGPFKGLSGFFEKLQTLPDGLTRALLLVEVLGSVQKLQIQLSQLKKA
jgi:transcriptional antiterminator RfaH